MTIKQKKAYVIMPNRKGGFCRIVDNVCVGHYSKRSTAVSGDYRDAQPCTKHTAKAHEAGYGPRIPSASKKQSV